MAGEGLPPDVAKTRWGTVEKSTIPHLFCANRASRLRYRCPHGGGQMSVICGVMRGMCYPTGAVFAVSGRENRQTPGGLSACESAAERARVQGVVDYLTDPVAGELGSSAATSGLASSLPPRVKGKGERLATCAACGCLFLVIADEICLQPGCPCAVMPRQSVAHLPVATVAAPAHTRSSQAQ